jgi:hypothetical protein
MKINHPMIRIAIFSLFQFALSFSIIAQSDNVDVHGIVMDYFNQDAVIKSVIIIEADGRKIFKQNTVSNKFRIALSFHKLYIIYFESSGYVSKTVKIDLRNIPREDQNAGFEMEIDMTIFKIKKGFDYSFLQEPIGIAKYDEGIDAIVWDRKYTKKMQSKVAELMQFYVEPTGDQEN